MSRKVFLSYARSDGEFARRLGQDLRASNIDVWIDQLDIRTGELWDQAVERALAGAVSELRDPASAAAAALHELHERLRGRPE